nr:hypothetical protein [Proteus mirabilis]
MVEDARSRGDTEQKTATSISDKAQKEAKSVQLKESDKPNRHRAHGSGLSGEAAYVEGLIIIHPVISNQYQLKK